MAAPHANAYGPGMKRALFSLSFVLATIPACGGDKVATYDGLIAKMKTFADEMCKCTDEACAKRVYDGLGKWAVTQTDAIENAKPTPPQKDAMKQVEDEFKACHAKAKGG
jgi:hypothetical protein